MNIGSVLSTAGRTALKNVPMGGVIMDVAELVVGDKFDRDVATGDTVASVIDKLPESQRIEFLAKSLDTSASLIESRGILKAKLEEDTPTSRARSYIAMAIAIMLLVLSAGFGLMLGHAYISGGIIPSIESLIVVFGLPTIALLAFFGLDTTAFQGIIVKILTGVIVKKSAKILK